MIIGIKTPTVHDIGAKKTFFFFFFPETTKCQICQQIMLGFYVHTLKFEHKAALATAE